jgi:hypothetical protein
MASTILLTTDVLIDRPALSSALVNATAEVMARRFGEDAREWRRSYQHVLEDWNTYWADLNLAETDSLRQWREGRWRIVRALFRLTKVKPPSENAISLHLDRLPREIGRRCDAWLAGAVEGVQALAGQGARVVLVAPTHPASLIRGMADSVTLGEAVAAVLGPDELGQVGLDDIPWEGLVKLAGGELGQTWLVSTWPDLPVLAPPQDLSRLAEVLPAGGASGDD